MYTLIWYTLLVNPRGNLLMTIEELEARLIFDFIETQQKDPSREVICIMEDVIETNANELDQFKSSYSTKVIIRILQMFKS
jgi:hypothetical protein